MCCIAMIYCSRITGEADIREVEAVASEAGNALYSVVLITCNCNSKNSLIKKECMKGYSNTNSNMHFHVQFYFK